MPNPTLSAEELTPMKMSVQWHGPVKRFERLHQLLEEGGENPTRAGERGITLTEIEETIRRQGQTCRCQDDGLRPGLTYRQLCQLRGCRDPQYACPTLVRLRDILRPQ